MKKVHLVKEKTLNDFVNATPMLRSAAGNWLKTLEGARWREPGDIKGTFSSADLLGDGSMRVIFDIGGNKYRMICQYFFGANMVKLYICWIGTHKEYDEICRKGLQYSISNY